MASEFRPGHPVVFWLAIIALVYGMYSGMLAMTQIEACRDSGRPQQHWQFVPPGWICDG